MYAPRILAFVLLVSLSACRTPVAVGAGKPVAVAPADALTPPALKLPDDVRPTRGELDLSLDPAAPTFHGVARYQLEVRRPTRVVWLNAKDLTLSVPHLTQAGRALDARVAEGDGSFVPLVLAQPLAVGAATLELTFQGQVDRTRSRGIYAAEENGAWYAYTFFEAVDARRAFPSFDQPDCKIPWTLTLRVPASDLAAANTPAVHEETQGDERVVHFAPTRPLPSYLVAFIVGPFDAVDGGTAGTHGTPLRFLVPRGRGAETRYAREVTPRLVSMLESYFGMPYPYGKLDVAVVPRFWGTMEHPGLVALGQPLTLIKASEDSQQRRRTYVRVAIHELAHYWFGDLVTCSFWDDTWLNESLATWLESKLTAAFEPSWHEELELPRMTAQAAHADELPTAKPLRGPIVTREDIESSFDGDLTYLKGASVVNMLEHAAGEAAFQRFVRRYLARHLDGVATSADFEADLRAELGPALAAALHGFVEQPGIPRVSAQVDCTGKTPALLLGAERSSASREAPLPREQWTLPVCFRAFTSGGGGGGGGLKDARCVSLAATQARFELQLSSCPTGLTLKPEGLGYYRADYQTAEYAPSRFGPGSPLSAAERIALLEDLRSRVDRGDLGLDQLLAVLPGLMADPSAELAAEGVSILRDLPFEAVSPEDSPRWHALVNRLVQPLRKRLGAEGKDTEPVAAGALRLRSLELLMLQGDVPELRRQMHARAQRLLAGKEVTTAEATELVLAAAALDAERPYQQALLEALRASHDPQARGRYFKALGMLPPALLPDSFAVLLEPGADLREGERMLRAALSTDRGRALALAFLVEHFEALRTRMRADEMGELVQHFGSLCDDAHAEELHAKLAAPLTRVDGGTHALAKAVEGIHACAARARVERPQLHAFLTAVR